MTGEVKDYNQMKKILFLLLILLPTGAWADQFTANILVNGKATPAEFVTIGDPNNYQCILGNGRNACISQYSAGSVTVPAYVHDNNKLYYVMGINAMAFRLCDKITSVDIQEETLHGGFEHMTVGTRSIGNFAFVGCSSLKEVELPATLKTIGSGAFINLPNLKKVKCNATTPPTWEYNDVFYFHADGISATETPIYNIQLFVPDEAIAAYSSSKFSNPSLGWNTPEGWANFITTGSHDAKATLRIQNAKELIAFRDAINSGIDIRLVELEADIDMSGEEAWTSAIGNTDEHPFRGTFNGNGHTISGLQVTASYAGLFGRIRDAKINDLVIKDCTFTGTDAAGAVCGRTSGIGTQIISGIYSENNTVRHAKYCGGLVGRGGSVVIQNSVVDRGSIIADDDNTGWIGGILGWAYLGDVYYCALFDTNLTKGNSKTGDIIAGNNGGSTGSITQCFSTWDLGECSANGISHNRCVYKGMDYDYKDENGTTHNFTFVPSKDQTMLCVGPLGLSEWVFCPGAYPLPACFEDRLPDPQPNIMSLRPSTMTTDRVNGLKVSNYLTVQSDWNDFSGKDNSFLNKASFTTSRLWVDDNFTGDVVAGMLPIGKTNITATNGLRYDRKLTASLTDDIIEMPVFETDDNGYIVYDKDGLPVITGYDEIEGEVYKPKAFPVYLPYNTTMPLNCSVYHPSSVISDEGGVAKIQLQQVTSREIVAYTPYYVVVRHGDVPLSTTAGITITKESHSVSLGDYEFAGSLFLTDKDQAQSDHLYHMNNADDRIWDVSTADNKQDIVPFSSYFRAKGAKMSEIQLVKEVIKDANFEYEMSSNGDGEPVLYITKYIGEGGLVTVPDKATVMVNGFEHEPIYVVDVSDNAFEEKADKIDCIDFSHCSKLGIVYVNREMQGNAFNGVKETSLIFMPDGKANMGVNVVVGQNCQKLLLKEGTDYVASTFFDAYHVEYEREMVAGQSYTICLPYPGALYVDGLKYYALTGVSGSTLQFTEVTPSTIGAPYLVVPTTDITNLNYDGDKITYNAVLKTASTTDSGVGYPMHGTFRKISPAETVGKYILQDGNKWQKAKTENPAVYIPPFRGYLTAPAGANASDLFDSVLDGDATGITNIHTTDKDGKEHWYDLNGRRIDGTPSQKGVYIQKGKKVISNPRL